MRYVLVLFVALVFSACAAAPATGVGSGTASPTQTVAPGRQTDSSSIEPVVRFLLISAAADFHKHGPSGPLSFRDVRIGHIVQPGGEKRYLLCGQFRSAQEGSKAEWTPFATIKTTGYEQWIGGQGDEYCQRSSFILDTESDLSSSLQNELDSLR
ncbi:MAG TPA: hypothetical protein VGO50_05420 [Pyrinomonadaceae bacterium]|jgi:hypothetical protein|nr:hypothetical protein [Pyrinomonadaceae bacterium]